MRDIFLLAVLPLLVYAMIKRPFIGIGLWIWTALFFPNGWVYGIAGAIRYNLLFAGLTIAGYYALKHKPAFKLSTTGILVLLFFVWTTVSTILGEGRPDTQWESWNKFLKVVALFLFVLAIIEKKLHVDFFLWCVVLSVGFYADLEAIKFLGTGGGHKIAGMESHVLGDRNELAVAFVMLVPICVYLLRQYGSQSRILALGLLGTIALLVTAVIGTQSRGGFIALLALGLYFYVKSDRKVATALVIGVMVLGLSQVVTSEWISRIDTINTAHQDESFMGRVVAWKLSFILALQNPIFGGGFKALEYFPNWFALSEQFGAYPWFYSGNAVPDTEHPHAAHSVYFQVLGEQGFVGLLIYLCVLLSALRIAARIARKARINKAPEWIGQLATMLQLSLFAFCIGGAALSFAYFDLAFAIIALLIVLETRILPAHISRDTK